jgi:hypothetical protein
LDSVLEKVFFGVNDLLKMVWRRLMLERVMRGTRLEFIGKELVNEI